MSSQKHVFTTTLAPGARVPYASWTFLVIPENVAETWGTGPKAVRGTLAGAHFRGTASRGEGVLRMPVPRELRDAAGVGCGDTVKVTLELDPEPRPVELPDELLAVFAEDAELQQLFKELPPAHRRAWAAYVAEAKRPDTRQRRASAASAGIRDRAFPK